MKAPAHTAREILPSTYAVLTHRAVAPLRAHLAHDILASLIRQAKARGLNGAGTREEAIQAIADDVARAAASLTLPSRRLINATGIVIHTGLGTAPLSPLARERMLEAAGATPTGAEGFEARTETVERFLRALTGAEAACVTVQNAATCTLVGAALAHGREIVCAARDLIEISQGVRLQDLIEAGGARVVPVGSANCVHLRDYERAITPHTALLLRIWHSNYTGAGYTSHVDTQGLARLAHSHDLPLVLNLGAGSWVDLREKSLPYSPTIKDGLRQGADLVLASGDKLIGGPQAGIAVGCATLVQQLAAHTLYRAVRPAKLDIAALEGTLANFLAGRAWEEIPVLRLLAASPESLAGRAHCLAGCARAHGLDAAALPDTAACGGAVLPGVALPTWTVALRSPATSVDALYGALLAGGVVGRRRDGAAILDLRSVPPEQDADVASALSACAPAHKASISSSSDNGSPSAVDPHAV